MVQHFFAHAPKALPLFEAVKGAIVDLAPHAQIRVQKSQIAFHDTRSFAYVWLPIRPDIKGRPKNYIVVSFGLDHKISNSRLVDVVEPYPNRRTHHLIIARTTDVDSQFRDWIQEAYAFSERK